VIQAKRMTIVDVVVTSVGSCIFLFLLLSHCTIVEYIAHVEQDLLANQIVNCLPNEARNGNWNSTLQNHCI
jgi:hypothetical protein